MVATTSASQPAQRLELSELHVGDRIGACLVKFEHHPKREGWDRRNYDRLVVRQIDTYNGRLSRVLCVFATPGGLVELFPGDWALAGWLDGTPRTGSAT